jgi:hypothetical protein
VCGAAPTLRICRHAMLLTHGDNFTYTFACYILHGLAENLKPRQCEAGIATVICHKCLHQGSTTLSLPWVALAIRLFVEDRKKRNNNFADSK